MSFVLKWSKMGFSGIFKALCHPDLKSYWCFNVISLNILLKSSYKMNTTYLKPKFTVRSIYPNIATPIITSKGTNTNTWIVSLIYIVRLGVSFSGILFLRLWPQEKVRTLCSFNVSKCPTKSAIENIKWLKQNYMK